MTEIIESIGSDGRKVHVIMGSAKILVVIEDEEGRQMTLETDETKGLAKIVKKYEGAEE